jgi:hypothetical protein
LLSNFRSMRQRELHHPVTLQRFPHASIEYKRACDGIVPRRGSRRVRGCENILCGHCQIPPEDNKTK